MSKLEKISISGIRSYFSHDVSGQEITFFTPLTVFQGKNGSGKSTIMEAIRYSCIGEIPNNFISNPYMYNFPNIIGSIKLKIRDVNREEVIVRRELKTVDGGLNICKLNEKVLHMKTVDGGLNICRLNERVVTSMDENLNSVLYELLGTSPAMFKYVLLCQQEQSLWPFGSGATLEKIFDEIFNVEIYNQWIIEVRKKETDVKSACFNKYKPELQRDFAKLECELVQINKQLDEITAILFLADQKNMLKNELIELQNADNKVLQKDSLDAPIDFMECSLNDAMINAIGIEQVECDDTMMKKCMRNEEVEHSKTKQLNSCCDEINELKQLNSCCDQINFKKDWKIDFNDDESNCVKNVDFNLENSNNFNVDEQNCVKSMENLSCNDFIKNLKRCDFNEDKRNEIIQPNEDRIKCKQKNRKTCWFIQNEINNITVDLLSLLIDIEKLNQKYYEDFNMLLPDYSLDEMEQLEQFVIEKIDEGKSLVAMLMDEINLKLNVLNELANEEEKLLHLQKEFKQLEERFESKQSFKDIEAIENPIDVIKSMKNPDEDFKVIDIKSMENPAEDFKVIKDPNEEVAFQISGELNNRTQRETEVKEIINVKLANLSQIQKDYMEAQQVLENLYTQIKVPQELVECGKTIIEIVTKIKNGKDKIHSLTSIINGHSSDPLHTIEAAADKVTNDLASLEKHHQNIENGLTRTTELKKCIKQTEQLAATVEYNLNEQAKAIEFNLNEHDKTIEYNLNGQAETIEYNLNEQIEPIKHNSQNNQETNFCNLKNNQEPIKNKFQNKPAEICKFKNRNKEEIRKHELRSQIESINTKLSSQNLEDIFERKQVLILKKAKIEQEKNTANYKTHNLIRQKVTKHAINNLKLYGQIFDRAFQLFHEARIRKVNNRIHELWRKIYKGSDVDYIKIYVDMSLDYKGRRCFKHKLMQKRNGALLEMRGWCSTGEKVLATLVIRIALVEIVAPGCRILALDDPTMHLDSENVESFSSGLVELINEQLQDFQLLIFTHDEGFLQNLRGVNNMRRYYKVQKNFKNESVVNLEFFD